jgi:ribosomal protein S18 acetylase RimI-like enzyme
VAAALVQAALAELRLGGFCVAQAVLDESAGPRAARDLIKGGMPKVTELLYLERDTLAPLTNPDGATHVSESDRSRSDQGFEWQRYEPAVESEFRAVLQSTYEESLDMPELEGMRSLNDILEGYQAAGQFSAERWQFGRIPGEPSAAAVLLLTEISNRDVWEVIYLGLTPAARSRGLGRTVLQRALNLTRPHASRLQLAVDLRNTPAIRLYRAAGFMVRDRRAVHLAVLRRPDPDGR